MKMHAFSKIGCGLMIGLLVPFSAALSAEDPHDRIQAHLGEGGSTSARDMNPPEAKQDATWQSQGAQGPIRTDMSVDNEAAAKQRAKDNQIFPLNAGG